MLEWCILLNKKLYTSLVIAHILHVSSIAIPKYVQILRKVESFLRVQVESSEQNVRAIGRKYDILARLELITHFSSGIK